MRNFNYTAREKSGAMKRGSVQAIDRNAALQELAAQGLVTLSVTEQYAVRKASLRLNPVKTVLTVIIIFIVAAVFWNFALKKQMVKNEKSQRVGRTVDKPSSKTKNNFNDSHALGKIKAEFVTNSLTADDAPVVRKRSDEPKNPLIPILDINTAPVADVLKTNAPQRYFSSGTEQIISGFANTKPGNPPPPLMNLPMNEDVTEILNRDIIVYNEDNERALEVKENTARMKQALKDYIKEGGTPETFLSHYHNELSKDYNEWKSAQQYIVRLLQEGDVVAAENFAVEQNTKFKERGIKSVVLPAKLLEQK
jgi:hypothetical protein